MRARFELAGIEHLKGDLEQAYKLYMMVAILYDNNDYCPKALLKAGEIFQTLGKVEEAKKAYREIANKYKRTDFAKEAKDRLKALK